MPLVINLKESEFGDDWDVFNPARYLDGSETAAAVLKNGLVLVMGLGCLLKNERMRCEITGQRLSVISYDARMFTFGGDFNTRNCVGKNLALQEMYLFAGRIFQCYNVSAKEKLSHHLQPGLTTPPRDPHPLMFHMRPIAADLVQSVVDPKPKAT